MVHCHSLKELEELIKSNQIRSHLTFGCNFNQPINEGMLPNSLTHLTFGWDFNQSINKGMLPNSLTHLTFGYNFNQPIKKDVLPSYLIKFKLYNIRTMVKI